MKVFVVYESHWGNTAAVARAIADGFGPEATVLTTDEAEASAVAEADLIVAGAPVMAFNLPSDRMIATMATDAKAPTPPDLSHPSMRARTVGTVRDRHALVAGRRDRGHHPQAGAGRLQAARQVPPIRGQRIVWTPARG